MGPVLLAFQAVPPAPGRPTAPGGPPPAPRPGPAQPAHHAAPSHSGGGGSAIGMLFPLLLLVPLLFLMFWSTRSQQKKQKAAVDSLKKGDRVLTQSGLVGKLVDLGDRYAKIEVAPGVKVDVLRTGLLGKDTAETASQVEKK